MIGSGQGEVFGEDFAEDDVHEADDQKGEDEGGGVQQVRRRGSHDGVKGGVEELIHGLFAGPAETQAGEGHADLGDREKALRVGEEAEGDEGSSLALVGLGAEARAANGDEGDLGGGEERVEGEDQEEEEKAKSHEWLVRKWSSD